MKKVRTHQQCFHDCHKLSTISTFIHAHDDDDDDDAMPHYTVMTMIMNSLTMPTLMVTISFTHLIGIPSLHTPVYTFNVMTMMRRRVDLNLRVYTVRVCTL